MKKWLGLLRPASGRLSAGHLVRRFLTHWLWLSPPAHPLPQRTYVLDLKATW